MAVLLAFPVSANDPEPVRITSPSLATPPTHTWGIIVLPLALVSL